MVVVVESEPGRSVSVAYVVDTEAPAYKELDAYVVVAFVVDIEELAYSELDLDASYVVGIEVPTYTELVAYVVVASVVVASVVVAFVVVDVEQPLFPEPEVTVEYGDRPP
jgi:hypothetical protein